MSEQLHSSEFKIRVRWHCCGNFAIDGLRSYGEESFPGTEEVINPDWRELDRARRSTTTKLVRARACFMDMDSQVTADPNHKRHENWQIKKNAKLEDINMLVQDLFTTPVDIKTDQNKKELHVCLHGASTPATNQAIASLLKEINQTETVFPGTGLTMVFESHIPAQNPKTGDT